MNHHLEIKKKAGEMAFMITTATLLQLAYRLIGMGDFGMAIMGKVWLLGVGMAMAVYGLNRWLKLPFIGAGLVLGLLVFTGKWHFGLYALWAIALGGMIQFVMDMRGESGAANEVGAGADLQGAGVKDHKSVGNEKQGESSTEGNGKSGSGHWFLSSVLVVMVMGLGVNWLINYNYEFLLERGWTHIDSVWHSAISSMYKHFGICSLGIDGLNPITYHTLMHKTIAGLSVTGGIPVIRIYALFYGVWAPVLLVAAMVALARKTAEAFSKEALVKSFQQWNPQTVGAGVWWTVAGILYMVFFRLFLFRGLNLGEEMLMSESHFMGLLFMLFAFITYLEYRKTGQVYLILMACAWLFVTSLAKSNLGVLAYGVMGVILVLGHIKDLRFWIGYSVSAAGFLAAMLKVAEKASEQTAWIAPKWGFAETVKEYATLLNYLPIPVFAVKVLIHFVLFYLPVWLLVWRYKRIFGAKWYMQPSIWMVGTLLLPSLAVNYVVGLGFNSFYFTNPVNFVAVIFLVVPMVQWADQVHVSIKGIGRWIQGRMSLVAFGVVIGLALYSVLDLHRMGSLENPNNYYYCRKEMSKKPAKPAMKAWINRANELQAQANGSTVLEYDIQQMVGIGYYELGGSFMVPGITEMVTVGHVPPGYFYTYGDYMGVKYPMILPEKVERVKF